jgi:hypothetical protein
MIVRCQDMSHNHTTQRNNKETDPPAKSVLASNRWWLPYDSVLSFPTQWQSLKRQQMIQKG